MRKIAPVKTHLGTIGPARRRRDFRDGPSFSLGVGIGEDYVSDDGVHFGYGGDELAEGAAG